MTQLPSEPKFKIGDLVSYDFSEAWRGGKGRVTNYFIDEDDNNWRYKVEAIEVPDGAKEAYPNGDHSSWDANSLQLIPQEAVEHPAHYGGDTTYEVIKVAEAWGLDEDAYLFNVLKYIARAGKKDGNSPLQDLKKGLFYYKRRICLLEDAQ